MIFLLIIFNKAAELRPPRNSGKNSSGGVGWPGSYKQGNAGLGIHDDWIEIAFITLPLFFLLLLIIRQHPSVSSRYVENSSNLLPSPPPPAPPALPESCHSYERLTRYTLSEHKQSEIRIFLNQTKILFAERLNSPIFLQ